MPKWMTTVGLCAVLVAMVVVGLQQGVADDEPGKGDADAGPARKVDLAVISDPSHEKMNLTAPDTFKALFKTTAGDFTVHVTRGWAPRGADRFYSLVTNGYYDGNRFFRVVDDFVVQWGVHGDKDVNAAWYDRDNAEAANLKDDKRKKSNKAGRVVFANAGPNTRSTQLFINLDDNEFLDDEVQMRGSIFAPFGEVDAEGMKVVRKLYSKYPVFDGRLYPDPSTAVSQGHLVELGNAYLDEYFPKLDAIKSATIVEEEKEEDKAE